MSSRPSTFVDNLLNRPAIVLVALALVGLYAIFVTGPRSVIPLTFGLLYLFVLYLLYRLVVAHEQLASGVHRIADARDRSPRSESDDPGSTADESVEGATEE